MIKYQLELELGDDIQRERAKKGLYNFTRSKQPFLHNIQKELRITEEHQKRFDRDIRHQLIKLNKIDTSQYEVKQVVKPQKVALTPLRLGKIRLSQRSSPRDMSFTLRGFSTTRSYNHSPITSPNKAIFKGSEKVEYIADQCHKLSRGCTRNLKSMTEQYQTLNNWIGYIKHDIDDRVELLQASDNSTNVFAQLSTKQYNRNLDWQQYQKGQRLKEKYVDVSARIAELGNQKLWKYTTKNFPKKTEKLLNSLPRDKF